ncbi:MAG: hypothetical protein JW395_1296 [Nitrospira sp.]|nr:hypothetical protein [Nitrospira sp.]
MVPVTRTVSIPTTAPLNQAACKIEAGIYWRQRIIATNPATISTLVGRLTISASPNNNW